MGWVLCCCATSLLKEERVVMDVDSDAPFVLFVSLVGTAEFHSSTTGGKCFLRSCWERRISNRKPLPSVFYLYSWVDLLYIKPTGVRWEAQRDSLHVSSEWTQLRRDDLLVCTKLATTPSTGGNYYCQPDKKAHHNVELYWARQRKNGQGWAISP